MEKTKNCWVIPTDKPSRLFKLSGDLHLHEECGIDPKRNQHIYITNDEEIKEGWEGHAYKEDVEGKVFKHFYTTNEWYKDAKKIILTTDQDLIKDGVQAIPDEFLEWFVKNPSCEEVEVIEQYRKCCRNTDGKNENCIEPINCEGWLSNEYEQPYKTTCEKRFEGYKIIIPKEEPKQETLEEITEQIQKDCHKFVDSIISKVTYQDATNTFLFMKLAELTLKLKKYE